MKSLYEEFEYELEKLTRLVAHAWENRRSVASDDTIIAQSQKVDALIGKLIKLRQEEEAKKAARKG
jgi:hypothetical protein